MNLYGKRNDLKRLTPFFGRPKYGIHCIAFSRTHGYSVIPKAKVYWRYL